MKIFMTYRTVDKPWGGANNFLRSLQAELIAAYGVALTDDVTMADIVFMNQVSSGPEHSRPAYTVRDIKTFRAVNPKAKIVFRAVNLKRHGYPCGIFRYYLGGDRRTDQNIIDVMHSADFVVFQSAYQKSFFIDSGYKGVADTVIHNGAARTFFTSGVIQPLDLGAPLTLLSSAVAKRGSKRHDLVAAISELENIRVFHAGAWPEDVPVKNVELCGTLDHEALKSLMAKCHYLLHPASKDPCPNSLIEALRFGLPVIFNPGEGSGVELAGAYGVPLNQDDLISTIVKARQDYMSLKEKILKECDKFGIDRAAQAYYAVFARQLESNV